MAKKEKFPIECTVESIIGELLEAETHQATAAEVIEIVAYAITLSEEDVRHNRMNLFSMF